MTFESELSDRLAATAERFDPDPAVLVDAERRATRRRRTRRAGMLVGAAAMVVAVVAVAPQVLDIWRAPDTPVIGVGPSERATQGDSPTSSDLSTPDADPEPSETDATASGTTGWMSMEDGPLGARVDAAATWTGEELFVWGGTGEGADEVGGAMYDPTRDEWRPVAAAPTEVGTGADAVWTGDRVLIFGGHLETDDPRTDPSRQLLAYDPSNDSWETFDEAPLEARDKASVTWTGQELIVWGGMRIDADQLDGGGPTPVTTFDDGAAFDPEPGTWRELADGPLEPRADHGAVWNGRRLIVFGGGSADTMEGELSWFDEFHDAAVYDPAADAWTPIDAPDTIGPLVAAHWTGDRIVYWTGHLADEPGNWLPPGGVWDPATGQDAALTEPPFDQRRDRTVSLWADELDAMITWGGFIGEGGNRNFDDGAAYHPDTDRWEALPDTELLGARTGHVAAWTGDELIVWGGATDGSSDGGAPGEYEPRADGAIWRP